MCNAIINGKSDITLSFVSWDFILHKTKTKTKNKNIFFVFFYFFIFLVLPFFITNVKIIIKQYKKYPFN